MTSAIQRHLRTINQLEFEPKSKAIVFKYDGNTNTVYETDHMAWGYTIMEVIAAGQNFVTLAYDGSLIEIEEVKEGLNQAITLRFDAMGPNIEHPLGMGCWFAIPLEALRHNQDIKYWIELARTEYLRHWDLIQEGTPDRCSYENENEYGQRFLYELAHRAAVMRNFLLTHTPRLMNTSDWNKERLKTIDPAFHQLYTISP